MWLLLKKWSKIEFFCPAKGVSLWEVQFCDSYAFLSHWVGQGPANAQLSAAEAVSRRQLRTRGRRLRNCRNAFLSHWARKGASGCATVGGGGSFQTTVAGARAAIAQLSQKSCPPWRQLRVCQRRAGAARLRVEILEKNMRSVAIVASIKKVIEN